MPRHQDSRLLPYSPAQMFDLVADVARYPEFLPWVIGARIQSRSEAEMVAELIVGFKMVRERFTSRVHLERPGHIAVDYITGPLKHLSNDWRFSPDGTGTRIDFTVDFAFRSRLFESLVGGVFTEAVRRMVQAFEKRALALYGAGASAASNSSSATRTA